MSEFYKLDTKDYTPSEMRRLLDLEEPYTKESVIAAEQRYKKRIEADDSIGKKKKKEIINFLSAVTKELVKTRADKQRHLIPSTVNDRGMVIRPPNRQQRSEMKLNPVQNTLADAAAQSWGRPTVTRCLALNSKFRDNYYGTLSTDFLVTLPTVIKQVVSMRISAFEIPNTYFQISKSLGNNYFWLGWQEGLALLMKWYFISIPDGSYTRSSMQSIINEVIQKATGRPAGSCPQCIIDNASVRTVFALPTTITNPNSFLQLAFNRTRGGQTTTLPDISFNELPNLEETTTNISANFGWILGYRMAEYKASTAYVSEGVYDAWGMKYLFVAIDDFNKNFTDFMIPAYNSSLGRTNIMARISLGSVQAAINGTSLAAQSGSQSWSTRQYFGPVDIQKVRITITDENGRVINLNNMDLSLAIDVVCLYN